MKTRKFTWDCLLYRFHDVFQNGKLISRKAMQPPRRVRIKLMRRFMARTRKKFEAEKKRNGWV